MWDNANAAIARAIHLANGTFLRLPRSIHNRRGGLMQIFQDARAPARAILRRKRERADAKCLRSNFIWERAFDVRYIPTITEIAT